MAVNDRAVAINSLLASLKLQAGGVALFDGVAGCGCAVVMRISGCSPFDHIKTLALQILVNPADPSSHIYKASAVGDATRCVAPPAVKTTAAWQSPAGHGAQCCCRFKGLTAEDMLVYQCIQGAGNMGAQGGETVLCCSGRIAGCDT